VGLPKRNSLIGPLINRDERGWMGGFTKRTGQVRGGFGDSAPSGSSACRAEALTLRVYKTNWGRFGLLRYKTNRTGGRRVRLLRAERKLGVQGRSPDPTGLQNELRAGLGLLRYKTNRAGGRRVRLLRAERKLGVQGLSPDPTGLQNELRAALKTSCTLCFASASRRGGTAFRGPKAQAAAARAISFVWAGPRRAWNFIRRFMLRWKFFVIRCS